MVGNMRNRNRQDQRREDRQTFTMIIDNPLRPSLKDPGRGQTVARTGKRHQTLCLNPGNSLDQDQDQQKCGGVGEHREFDCHLVAFLLLEIF